jgi:hypothetical protein
MQWYASGLRISISWRNSNLMKKWTIIFLLFLYPFSYAQLPDTSAVIHGKGTRGPYSLGFRNLISNSTSVLIDGRTLNSDSFSVECSDGLLRLGNPLPVGDSVIARFRYIPLDLRSEYYLHKFEMVQNDSILPPDLPAIRPMEDVSDISISGSKGFSIETGNGANGLSQSLNLTLQGNLVPGLKTSAHISDKSQGNSGVTRRLEELDKIYIEAQSDNFKGTFGDFDYVENTDPLINFQRKLTGLNALYSKNGNTVKGAAAFFPGDYSTNTINGRDGVLGPYYLTDVGGRPGATVLPGSEKVYVDGILQRRGSQDDYTIDYEAGTIQFAPSKVIRNETRITLDYEISREEYSRSLYAASAEAQPVAGLRIFSSLMQEGDNKNSPKSFELTPDVRNILNNAGADRLNAFRSGVQNVGPDSGDYESVIDSTGNLHFNYVGPYKGNYKVSFSFIGTGAGSYKLLGAGVYQYVGKWKGDYEPVILIPLPESKRYGSIGSSWSSRDSSLSLTGEIAGSLYDRNMLSSHDNVQQSGTAMGTLAYQRHVFGDKGFIGVNGHLRKIGQNSIFPGRIDDVERYRKYDLDPNSPTNGEKVEEFALSGGPAKDRTMTMEFGYLTRFDIKSRIREAGALNWRLFGPVAAFSNFEKTTGNRTWWKRSGGIQATFARFQPKISIDNEQRDGLDGFKYNEYVSSIPATYTNSVHGQTDFDYRNEKFLDSIWKNKFRSGSVQQKIDYIAGSSGLSGEFAGSYYRKHYTDGSGTDSQQKTGWTQINYSDPGGRGSLSVNERLSSANQRLQAKDYIFVGIGKGDYKLQDGEYIQYPQGDYTVVIEELGEGQKITEVGSEINSALSPFLIVNRNQGVENTIGQLNVESNLVYNLRKSSDILGGQDFIPWRGAQSGNIVLQNGQFDLRFFYYPPAGKHRIRYNLSRSFENGAPYANEATDDNSRSDEISWAFPVEKKIDIFLSTLFANSRHFINSVGYTIDRKNGAASVNYRFQDEWTLTLGTSFEIARETDTGLRASEPSAELGLIRDLKGKGRITSKFTYTRMNINPRDAYVPFQVAQGRGPGDNFEALLSARMAITKNGKLDFSYRYQHFVHRPEEHNLRLEFTVLFL